MDDVEVLTGSDVLVLAGENVLLLTGEDVTETFCTWRHESEALQKAVTTIVTGAPGLAEAVSRLWAEVNGYLLMPIIEDDKPAET